MINPIESQPNGNGIVPSRLRTALAPVRDIGRKIGPRKESEEQKLEELTGQVVEKLLQDISEQGYVSFVHDKKTGVLKTAIFKVYLTPIKLTPIWVMLNRHYIEPSQSSFDFIATDRMFLEADEGIQDQPCRSIIVSQRWNMPENSYEL
jgi:hypothetical protein